MKKQSLLRSIGTAILGIVFLVFYLGDYAHLLDPDFYRDQRDAKQVPAEEFLESRLLTGAERIYLQRYYLSQTELSDAWTELLYNDPELFFVDGSYRYATWSGDILYVEPDYVFTREELPGVRADYDAALDRYLSPIDPQWSDLEKALYLHDRLALEGQYDTDETNYTAYDLFVDGSGVCQAYAQAYLALLQQFGIDCRIVTSEAMNHAWVILRLDGAWYNVDVTHDDPVQDRLGHVLHSCFLKSDQALKDSHTGGDAPVACTSDRYDTAVWDDVNSAFVPVNGVFYCISGNQLCRWDDDGLTPLYTVRARWYVDGDPYSYWDGCFSALAADGDTLLFNTPDDILRYDIAAGTVSTAGHYDGPGDIYGFTYDNGTARCQVGVDPNDAPDVVPLKLTD